MFRRAVVQVQRRFPRRGIEEFWSQGDPQLQTGRAWYASELRNKSFNDLHKLWFVLLKERNLLETERHLARQTGVKWEKPGRLQKVKKSMARLKTVVHLRSLEHKKEQLHGATSNASTPLAVQSEEKDQEELKQSAESTTGEQPSRT